MIKASLEEVMQIGDEVSPVHDVDAALRYCKQQVLCYVLQTAAAGALLKNGCVLSREIERDDLEMMTSSTGGPDGTMYQVQLDTCMNLARIKARICATPE